MEDYNVVDGKTVATSRMKVKRFFNRYPDVSRDMPMESLQRVFGQIQKSGSLVLVTYQGELRSEVLASLLMRNQKYDNLVVYNAYSLIDIFLGNNEDVQSLLDIDRDIVCVYAGYNEFENKRAQDVILQVADQQKVHYKKFWFLYKGNDMKERYALVYRYFEENRGLIYDLNSSANQTSVSEEEEII